MGKIYTSTLKSMPYFYAEFKMTSKLKLHGLNAFEIKKRALEENLFMVKTEARKREIASRTLERVDVLDDYLLGRVVEGTVQTSKQIALYSILKNDLLFVEFMNEVYREKILLSELVVTDKDFSIFFTRKMEQSEQVNKWKEYTFYKLKQVYKRILGEAGFAKREGKDILILPQIMDEDVHEHIKGRGDEIYIKAMLGEM